MEALENKLAETVVNMAPGMSIPELQAMVEDLDVKAVVVNDSSVKKSDVDMLYDLMKEGYSIIIFIKMRNSKDASAVNPDGHFISLNPLKNDTVELFDPAGDDVRDYLEDYGEWIPELVLRFKHLKWFKTRTQPPGTNSCGPWSVIRAGMKNMPEKLFTASVVKAASLPKTMDVTRKHTLEAFGPIGREAPHMSTLKAQHYCDFLREHTNLNEPAAKHVAHVINRAVARSDDVASSHVSDMFGKLKEALPALRVSDDFLKQYGGGRSADFNAYVKQLKKKRAKKSVAEQALSEPKAGMKAGKKAGAPLAGAALAGKKAGAALAGRKAGAPLAGKRAGALLAGKRAGALLSGGAVKRGGALLAGAPKGGALLAGAPRGGGIFSAIIKGISSLFGGAEAKRIGGKMMAAKRAGAGAYDHLDKDEMDKVRKAMLQKELEEALEGAEAKGGCCCDCCHDDYYYDEDEGEDDEPEYEEEVKLGGRPQKARKPQQQPRHRKKVVKTSLLEAMH